MTTDTVTLSITREFAATPAQVRRAFTEPSMLAEWWGPPGTTLSDVTIDARPGGRYSFTMRLPEAVGRDAAVFVDVSGEFTRVEDRLLEYSYRWQADEHVTQVSVELAGDPAGGTQLTVRHEGLPNVEFAEYESGWNASLDRLADLMEVTAETGGAPPS